MRAVFKKKKFLKRHSVFLCLINSITLCIFLPNPSNVLFAMCVLTKTDSILPVALILLPPLNGRRQLGRKPLLLDIWL